MRIELMFPSKYLAAADLLEHGEKTLTIQRVEVENVRTRDGAEEKKVAVRFKGAKKALLLNKTNAMIIRDLYGSETDKWRGERVTLYPARVQAFGKMVDAVRVRDKAPRQDTQRQSAPEPDFADADDAEAYFDEGAA